MKNPLIITTLLFLTLNTLAANHNPIHIKLNTAIVYGEQILGNFEGNLTQFIESDFFTPDYSEGELEFILPTNDKSYFKNAKVIARYAWKFLTDNVTVNAPYPCGYYFHGNIHESFKTDTNNTYTEYSIKGEGDGSFNSCSGQGGPGRWSYQLTIKFDPNTSTGTIIYNLEEE